MSSGPPPPTGPPRSPGPPPPPEPPPPPPPPEPPPPPAPPPPRPSRTSPIEAVAAVRRQRKLALLALGAVVVAGATVAALALRGRDDASTSLATPVPVVTATAAPQPTTTFIPEPATTVNPQPTATLAPAPTAIVTAAPTTTPPPAPAPTVPHGAAIETRCVRSDIDFDAVREAPGVTQPEVGRIPPSTCNVQVYATGTDGRITWLEVGIGDIFGWSAESNFLAEGLGCAPDGSTCE